MIILVDEWLKKQALFPRKGLARIQATSRTFRSKCHRRHQLFTALRPCLFCRRTQCHDIHYWVPAPLLQSHHNRRLLAALPAPETDPSRHLRTSKVSLLYLAHINCLLYPIIHCLQGMGAQEEDFLAILYIILHWLIAVIVLIWFLYSFCLDYSQFKKRRENFAKENGIVIVDVVHLSICADLISSSLLHFAFVLLVVLNWWL
jgi:hypothetical protein